MMKSIRFGPIARKVFQHVRHDLGATVRKAHRFVFRAGGLRVAYDSLRVSARVLQHYEAHWQQMFEALTPDTVQVDYQPRISILMPVCNSDLRWLRQAIASVQSQHYTNWELCIADDASTAPGVHEVLQLLRRDDARIKIIFRTERGHIAAATNSALTLASGEFIALLDHDDELTPDALLRVVQVLNQQPDADFIYSDEDKIETDGQHTEPFFKPQWSPHLLLNINYMTHFAVIRRQLLDDVGDFRTSMDGSQDYDLFLRVAERTTNIIHIPHILYSWRKSSGSAALHSSAKDYAMDKARLALEDALKRRQIKAQVQPGRFPPILRVRYPIYGAPPVSIIIPTRGDSHEQAQHDLQRLLKHTAYANLDVVQIVVGDTHATQHDSRLRYIETEPDTPVVQQLRQAVSHVDGAYLLFVAPGLQPQHPDWVEALLEYAQQPGVGCVGTKLLHARRIQHAGLSLDAEGLRWIFRGVPDGLHFWFPLNLKDTTREVLGVSAACMMLARKHYDAVNGFDVRFDGSFDLALGLSLRNAGYSVLYTPYAAATLPAPITRQFDDDEMSLLPTNNIWLPDPFFPPKMDQLMQAVGLPR